MKFRILAFPLASSSYPLSRTAAAISLRQSISATSSNSKASNVSNPILYYYLFQTYPSESELKRPPNPFRQVVDKSVGAWNKMGLASEGNWKRKLYVYGERLMDQIDFEETSLKILHPPSKASRSRGRESKESEGTSNPLPPADPISLVYPSNFPDPLANFRETIVQRTPLHRSGFWRWMIIAPFTAPFALVPIIPNLPFFFCAWRSWSHHRAWKSADYLQDLLESGAIRSEPNDIFSEFYPGGSADLVRVVNKKQSEGTNHESEEAEEAQGMLLSLKRGSELVKSLGLQDRVLSEITKALEQAAARLEKAKRGR